MNSEVVQIVLQGWLYCALLMLVLYVIQWIRKDASLVDVGWSLSLGFLAVFYFLQTESSALREIFLLMVAGGWSLRLTVYLLFDRIIGKPEDGRYQMLRENWGGKAQGFFFLFFQAQGLLDVIFSIPFLVVLLNPTEGITYWDCTGLAIGVTAIAGEHFSDRQLAVFRSNPSNKGKTCRLGLWRYSRHPNYFFEFLHWWAYVFLAVGSPYWWVTLIAPILMFIFIFRITGIPYTEKQALKSRGEDYRRYQESTSMFIPWFPKEERK